MRTLSVLGSTGSIGKQTLQVAREEGFRVAAVCARSSVEAVEAQAREFGCELAVLFDEAAAQDLKIRLGDTGTKVLSGMDGLCAAAELAAADTVLGAMSGMVGLKPALAAINAKKRLALANKETLVCAGDAVIKAAEDSGAEIIPVDSEHSAIFQCLQCRHDKSEIKRLILTASGGPFRGKSLKELESVTLEQALKHPNWSMGAKITVDSATLMNKGLEVIEAMHLFSVPREKIGILVHPQSIIHSMVEFRDNAVLAQLGTPDMKLPIRYALTYPARSVSPDMPLDLLKISALTFERPDTDTFKCLAYALEAAERGGTAGAVLNAANEIAAGAFLKGRISFLQIADTVGHVISQIKPQPLESLESALEADAQARECALRYLGF